MKNYKLKINGTKYEVSILGIEDNLAELEVNGTKYEVEIDQKLQPVTKTPKLVVQNSAPSTDAHQSTMKTASPSGPKGTGTIKSPLPGTILSINVGIGSKVNMGDKLITLEAMKMENNINSDKEGTVKSIRVKVGDSVLEGDTLIEIG